jgi:hypothetical protein
MDQMTVVEINPGMDCIWLLDPKAIPDPPFVFLIGLGAWTSALYNGGFNKIYSLEPTVPYLKQLEVRPPPPPQDKSDH